jgi:hypothetical protein
MRLTSRNRWIIALGVSLGVHVGLLLVMMIQPPRRPLVEYSAVQISLAIPRERVREREKPPEKPVERPAPTPSAPAPRPVEAPPQVAPSPLPPAPAPAPPQPAPAAPVAQATGPFRLGCDGRAFDALSREEQARCVRNLAPTQRTFSPGEQKTIVPPTDRQRQFAAEAAANAARNRPVGTNPTKTGGCPEGNLGIGCTDDMLSIGLVKKKF